jgi:hypothetical protein
MLLIRAGALFALVVVLGASRAPLGLAAAAAPPGGDIPDNQVFVTFTSPASAWSMKYPEGWAQTGAGSRVTFRNLNNVVSVVVARGPVPSLASVRRDVARLRLASAPSVIRVSAAPAIKVSYLSSSAPNPVTGRRVNLVVDRYYLAHGGRVAVVDLATPVGVDNVDAYRLIVDSFRWR